MGFLNFQYGLLSYEDKTASNPNVRNSDITESFQDLVSNHENTAKFTIAPGETKTLAATVRPLGHDGTTQYALERPVATDSILRLRWTGGSQPGFRLARSLGADATTTLSIVRAGPNTARLQSVGGTPINTANVQTGDVLKFARNTDTFTSPFGPTNLGQSFIVQAKGSGYVDFLDNGAAGLDGGVVLGTGFQDTFRILSPQPVKTGDTVLLEGMASAANAGEFKVTDYSSDYIEFVNPYGVAEAFSNVGGKVRIYDHLMTFIHISASAPLALAFDGGTSAKLGRLGPTGPALLMGSAAAYQVDATNNGQEDVQVVIRHMGVNV